MATGSTQAFTFGNGAKAQETFNSIFEVYQPFMLGMPRCGMAVSSGYMAIGAEWLGFLHHRLQKDLALQEHITKCRNPQDLLEEWNTFMRTAAEDYHSEMTRLTEIGSSTSGAAFSALQDGADVRSNGLSLN